MQYRSSRLLRLSEKWPLQPPTIRSLSILWVHFFVVLSSTLLNNRTSSLTLKAMSSKPQFLHPVSDAQKTTRLLISVLVYQPYVALYGCGWDFSLLSAGLIL